MIIEGGTAGLRARRTIVPPCAINRPLVTTTAIVFATEGFRGAWNRDV